MAWKNTFGEYAAMRDTFAMQQRRQGSHVKRSRAEQRAAAARLALPSVTRTSAAKKAGDGGGSARVGPPGFGPEAKSYLERLMHRAALSLSVFFTFYAPPYTPG